MGVHTRGISCGVSADFANLAAPRSWCISSPKIDQLRLDSLVSFLEFAIRCIAGVVKKLAFFLTGRALIRRRIRFEGISAF
jgi:hypothetical protein